MKRGHAVTLVGALLALIGGLLLQWQEFSIAGVAARSFEVPLAGQLALLLAAVVAVAAGLGLRTRRPRRFLGVTLTGSVFFVGWMVVAHTQRDGGLALMDGETVALGLGYTVALWGAVIALLGALMAVASEPRWSPRETKLRVAVLQRGTVVRELVIHEPRAVTMGSSSACDIVLADLAGIHALLTPTRAGSYELALGELSGGFIEAAGTRADVLAHRDGAAQEATFALDEGSWGVVEVGDSALYVQHLRPEAAVTVARREVGADESLGASLGASFFVQAAVVVVSILLWDSSPVRATFVEDKRNPDLVASVQTLAEPKPPELDADDRPESTEGKAAGGVEGKFGTPDAPPDRPSKVPRLDAPRVAKVEPTELGLNSLLSTRNLNGGGAIATLFRESSDGIGNKLAVAMGGPDDELVIGPGTRGMSFQGDGDGGPGGDGPGRLLSQGTLDTRPGVGIHASLGDRKPRKVPTVTLSGGTVSQLCSRRDISTRMNRLRGAVRACYEQRLQVKEGLAGKLSIQWTIGGDGSVGGAEAVEDTIGDRATTDCVLRSLRRARFAPPEGGVCVVRWPFVFSAR